MNFPGLAGLQTRRFGGFCYFGISVSRPREYGAVYAAKSAYLASVRDAASDRKSRCRYAAWCRSLPQEVHPGRR